MKKTLNLRSWRIASDAFPAQVRALFYLVSLLPRGVPAVSGRSPEASENPEVGENPYGGGIAFDIATLRKRLDGNIEDEPVFRPYDACSLLVDVRRRRHTPCLCAVVAGLPLRLEAAVDWNETCGKCIGKHPTSAPNPRVCDVVDFACAD